MYAWPFQAQAIDLVEAMNGKLSREDCFLISKHFPEEYQILMTIPRVSETAAAVILGKIAPDVEAFPTDGHLASWAGLCPGSYESAVSKNPRE